MVEIVYLEQTIRIEEEIQQANCCRLLEIKPYSETQVDIIRINGVRYFCVNIWNRNLNMGTKMIHKLQRKRHVHQYSTQKDT